MALVISDRVKETTTTTGTGTVTLAGAVTGFRTFGSVLSINDTTYYAIVSSSEFEVGIGTFTSSTTLTRDTVLSSSNSNLKVDFGAGSKNVFITQPADKAIYQDASGNVAGLNTDNVTEGSTNLYFTDERVDDRVGSLLVAGDNVTLSYDDAAGTLTISATEDNLSNNDTDDLAEGSTNLYYTSARANADFDTRLATKDTDDLSEGLTNLYYTNERVDDRVANLLQDGTGISFAYDDSNNVLTPTVTLSPFSTTNLSEGTNLYFTNERVDDRVANLLTAGSNITLTYDDTAGTLTIAGVEDDLSNNDTDDLSEGATNLYFTNERVDDRVSALVQNGTGISWSYNDVSGTLTPTVSLSAFSTSDLSEGTNLYYTTARFDSAFSGKSTSDLSEGTNLYYTTARFDTAFGGKDTDDLSEGSTNLYYTDTRANAAIDARVTQSFVNALNVEAASVQANSVALGTDTTGNYIANIAGTANKITVTGSGSESAAVTLTLPDDVQIANDLTVAGDLTVNGATTTLGTTNLEVSDNLFELNAGLTTAPVNDSGMLIQRGTSDNAIFMWDESADKFTLGTTTSDATVTGNIVITTGSLVANLEGNVTGNVTGTVSSLSNHDTDDLSEGSSNLYYTDARSRAAISASGDISYNSSTGVISFTQATAPVTSVNTQTGAVVLDTDDISEGASNLYYTAARFNSAFAAKSTSDLSEGTNLYLTQERVEDYVGGMVSGNTETGIAVTYDDTLGKLNFVIDTLNQDTTGNAATATALETARNFSLTGDVTASAVSFDGTGNVALSTSIAANTVGITELNVTDGTNGQVLTTDGAGSLSFSSISGYSDSDVETYLDGGTSTPTFASATVSGDFTVDTSTLKVDSTNNRVGIGTASPTFLLDVYNSSGGGVAKFSNGDNDNLQIKVVSDEIVFDSRNVSLTRFLNQGNDALCIDSSLNVLVGKTTHDNGATAGIELEPNGQLNVAVDGSFSRFNRLTSDGTVIDIRKDGTSVGSLGTLSWLIGQDSGDPFNSGALFKGQTTGAGYIQMKVGDTASGGILIGDTTDDFRGGLITYGTNHPSLPNRTIIFANNTQVITALSSGNVGLGTNTPQRRLTVGDGSGSEILSIYAGNTSASALHFTDTNTTTDYQGFVTYNHAEDALRFGAAEEEKMRLTSTGLDAAASLKIESSTGGELILSSSDTAQAADQFIAGLAFKTADASAPSSVPHYAGIKSVAGDVFGNQTLEFYSGRDRYEAGTNPNMVILGDTTGTDGNVGIGTSSPAEKLHISGTNSALRIDGGTSYTNTSEIILSNGRTKIDSEIIDGTANGDTAIKFSNRVSGTLAERMRIDHFGNVGIGTASPAYALDVHSGGDNVGIRIVSTDTNAFINFEDDTTTNAPQVGGVGDDLIIRTGSLAERLRIDSSGNVGIGTSSPDTLLTMQDDSDVDGSLLTFKNQYRVSSTTADIMGGIAFSAWRDVSSSASYCAAIYGKNTGYPGSSGNLVFATRTNGDSDPTDVTERMRIDSSGNVGIGETSPSSYGKFAVTAAGIGNHINSTSGAGGINFYESGSGRFSLRTLNGSAGLAFYDSFNGSERMRISSGGVVNVNHTSGALNNDKFSVKQAVANTSYAAALWNSASGSYQTILSIGTGTSYTHRGGIHYDATGGVVQYLTTSDSRLKTETGDADGLSIINALRPIKFTWNETGNEQQGFFAQEVQEIVPSAVAGVEDEDDYLSMDYSRLVTPLVKAVQELSAKVEALEAQLQGN
jgi:hypothetical protein